MRIGGSTMVCVGNVEGDDLEQEIQEIDSRNQIIAG